MAIQVVINNQTYSLPTNGDPSPWGADLTDVILALVGVASASTSTGDILPSTFSLANNVTSPAPVTGLSFDQSVVRSAIIQFSINRSTATQEVTDEGFLYVGYNTTTNTWSSSQDSSGKSGVLFDVTAGQITFTSSNMTGSNYVGKLGFSARAFSQ